MIDKVGLPGKSMVGEDGAEAAWSIIQNAISLPDLQREMLPLLQEAAGEGEFPLLYPAYLEDCIRFHEGRPLRYDIYSDWTDSGVLDILPIEDEASVDSLRLSIGLPPLEEARKNLLNTKEHPPKDIKQKKELYQNWRKKVGWM
jgi:hypothetical protein